MKNMVVIVIVLCMPLFSISQIRFEKGYLVDKKHVKTECLIKSVDWLYNPNSFQYKLSEGGRAVIATVNDVEEFGVPNEYKYVAANVSIDRSSDELEYMSADREPAWSNEKLLLKVLTEGKATLYSYKESNLSRFFYKKDSQSFIEQLIYKAFLVNDEGNFLYNKTYISQINVNINCDNVPNETLGKIPYKETELKKYFQDYNMCKGDVGATFDNGEKTKWFSLKLAPLLRHSQLKGGVGTAGNKVSFDPKFSFAAGLELEFVLPFNKSKWSVVLLPSTFSYKSTGTDNRTIDYNSIEIAGGLRYSFYVNDKLKAYPDISLVKDIKRGSVFNVAYGLGVSYKRVSAEFRYYSPRMALDYYQGDFLAFHKEALIIGYRIF